MTIKIEKGVKIPAKKGRLPTEFTKTLASLKVLESFFTKLPSAPQALCSWVSYHKRKERFITRTMDGGTRIWRIK